MNKRCRFQRNKKPIAYWFGKVGYGANALFRLLGLNGFDRDTSSSPSPRNQNHGGDAQTSLIPIRIPIERPKMPMRGGMR